MRTLLASSLVAVALITGTLWLFPAQAVTATPTYTYLYQGTAEAPFLLSSVPSSVELVDDGEGGQDLRLAMTDVFSIRAASRAYEDIGAAPHPRSVQSIEESGDLLIADDALDMVLEVARNGVEVWRYRTRLPADQSQIFSAQRFIRGGEPYTLIADRDADRVYVVDMSEEQNIVWQYGSGEDGLGVNRLKDPLYARYYEQDGGVVLITDNHDAHRVIEVSYGDYDPAKADNGFTSASIVAQYGTPGVPGTAPGQLDKPKSAELLGNGHFLVADEDAARVTEVDPVSGTVVWQVGTTGVQGDGDGHLRTPNHATRLDDGDTLICDEGNGRVLRFDYDKNIVAEYDLSVVGRPPDRGSTDSPEPRTAAISDDGLLVVGDSGFDQVVLLGRSNEGVVTSLPLDGGAPRAKKAFDRLSMSINTGAAGTSVTMQYRIDGGRWWTCDKRKYEFPKGSTGWVITYRVTLESTTSYVSTPVLKDFSIRWTKPKAGGAGGGGGGKPGGSGNSGQSGTYTYPSSALGGTGTSGTGTGSGAYGSGTGSGSYGSGTGSASSGAGASSSTSAESLQPPVQSSGSGPAVPVQGIEVQGEEGVSGVPLRAAKGPHVSAEESSGPPVPVLAMLAVAGVVLAGLFIPWPLVAAQIRRIAGFDHTRPTRFLPFRPLRGGRP